MFIHVKRLEGLRVLWSQKINPNQSIGSNQQDASCYYRHPYLSPSLFKTTWECR